MDSKSHAIAHFKEAWLNLPREQKILCLEHILHATVFEDQDGELIEVTDIYYMPPESNDIKVTFQKKDELE